MGFRQALPDVLSHAQAERSLDLAAVELFAQFLNGGDTEFLVDPSHAFWVEAWMVVDARDCRSGFSAQGFQLPQGSGLNDFPDSGGDSAADARLPHHADSTRA